MTNFTLLAGGIAGWWASIEDAMAEATVNTIIGITVVLSYITLIFGELVPKRIAMQSAEKIALFMSGFIYLIAKIFVPIVWFLTYSTNLVLKILGINPEEKNEQITEEEIKIMVDVGSENGNIDDIEKSIIHNIFEFDDKLAEEIVTHRTDTIFINIDDPIEKWEQIIIQHRFSVYPIYQNEHDNIVGIINIKDFFKFNKQGKQTVINNAVQPPFFVSKSKHINELFIIMQKNRNHFAVVVDEYGGIYGIITMNDVLEQIVGELEDDHQMPVSCPNISKIKDKTWKIKGSTPISEVVSCLKIKLPEDMYDTFGGFVMTLLGEIPSKNQKIEVAYNNMKIVISNIKSRRIEETIVTFED